MRFPEYKQQVGATPVASANKLNAIDDQLVAEIARLKMLIMSFASDLRPVTFAWEPLVFPVRRPHLAEEQGLPSGAGRETGGEFAVERIGRVQLHARCYYRSRIDKDR